MAFFFSTKQGKRGAGAETNSSKAPPTGFKSKST